MYESDTGAIVATLALGWSVGSLLGHVEIAVAVTSGFIMVLLWHTEMSGLGS